MGWGWGIFFVDCPSLFASIPVCRFFPTARSSVPQTFDSPRCYDPSYSLLGRAFRRWTGDRLQAEALYVVAFTGLALMLLMGHYLGWALLKPYLTGEPSRQLWFWAGQLGSAALWGATGLLGFKPGVTATCTPTTLRLAQGGRTRTVNREAIERASLVSATCYYRHYRRYAATDVFVGRVPDEVLLLHTPEGPVAVGLADSDDRTALLQMLEGAPAPLRGAVPSEA